MATANPFDLLGDDDNDDPSQLIAAQQQKIPPKKAPAPTQQATAQPQKPPAKLPTKPAPPAQAVREARTETGRGGGRGGGRGYPRGRGGGFNRDLANNESSFSSSGFSGGQGAPERPDGGKPSERRVTFDGPRPFRGGGRRGGFSNGEVGDRERPRRGFERHSGTGRGNEIKREGAGQGNWGSQTDELAQVAEEVNEGEKTVVSEKPIGEEDAAADGNKDNTTNESEEKEREEKEMTLEEYEKVLEEKRKALQAIKTEGRKVDTKEFETMQQLSSKKGGDDVFIKLGSDKDKRRESAEKEEKAKKSVSINEFLKPVEGERFYSGDGRGGRGSRGRGGRGGRGGFSAASTMSNAASSLSIEDPGQFPTLGAK